MTQKIVLGFDFSEVSIKNYQDFYDKITNSKLHHTDLSFHVESLIKAHKNYSDLNNIYKTVEFNKESNIKFKSLFNDATLFKEFTKITSDYLSLEKSKLFEKQNPPIKYKNENLKFTGELLRELKKNNFITVEEDELYERIISHKISYLKEILDCLIDKGLHSNIQKRNKSFEHFNIIIYYNGLKSKTQKACRIFLSKDELNQQFIKPYFKEKKIIINGKEIPKSNIQKIKITNSFLKKEELKYFTKNLFLTGSKYDENILEHRLAYTNACNDVTDQYITANNQAEIIIESISLDSDIWNSKKLNEYVELINSSIKNEEYKRSLTLCYTNLEGFFKAFIKHKIPTQSHLVEIIAMSKEIKKYLKDSNIACTGEVTNQITNVAHAVDSIRNQFSESHHGKEPEKWLAIFIKDSSFSIIRMLLNFIK